MHHRLTIMTPHLAHEVADWWQKAINDSEIARFISGSNFFTLDLPQASSWQHTILMDSTRNGMAILKHDSQPSKVVNFECFVLPCANPQLIAGRMLKGSIEFAAKDMGGRWLEWSCHSTNEKCINISHKLGARQWGNREEHFWDPYHGFLVGSYHFRLDLKKAMDAL